MAKIDATPSVVQIPLIKGVSLEPLGVATIRVYG